MSKAASPITEVALFVGAPTPTRAQAFLVTTAGTSFAYPSGNSVVVRDLEDPKKDLVCSLHNAPVTVARLAPSGAMVASGDRDGNLIVWVNRIDTLEKYKTKALGGAIRDIAWSDDGERIVVVGEGKGSYAAVMTLSGNTLGSISGHSQPIVAVDFRKSRPYRIATGGLDAVVNFFEGPPFKFAHSVQGHKNGVNAVRFSPNNERIATVSGSNEIILLDGKTGEKTSTIATDHTGTIYGVAWSADSSKLATAAADKTVKVFESVSGALVWSAALGTQVGNMQQGVLFHADKLLAFALNGDIIQLSAIDGSVAGTWRGNQKAAVFLSFDAGSGTLESVAQDGSVLVWPNASPKDARSAPHEGGDVVGGACRLQGGSGVAAVTSTDIIVVEQGAARSVAKFASNPSGIASLPSGAFAVLQKSSVTVLGSGGDKIAEEKLPGFDASSITSHQNMIAIGGEKSVKVFRFNAPASLELLVTFAGSHAGTVTSVVFSPDGQSIASGDSTRQIFVWSVADGKVLQDEMVFHSSRVTSLAFNATGELLASGSVDSSVIVWEIGKKKHMAKDYAHRGGVTAVTFGPQNEIFTSGGDNCIRRWKF
jgi:WD40 repeat protein